ncbi:hypothetical protein DFH08DRAFT_863010 [Mycena albidolilacea]|uniref:Uncharacterized protein n=1 Tax=Mycena albidolilacea TaxID=1033008 RepID=A0AAD7A559_9AGAR|nr:hypothetical protein DFH08DRAFT_863010 [Mycena albidolilacea]
MPRQNYHSRVLRSYMTHMTIRDIITPPEDLDFTSLIDKLSVDIQTLHAIRTTRYLGDRGHVAKAGNLHLAWVYAGNPNDHGRFTNMLRVSPYVFGVLLDLIKDHEVFSYSNLIPIVQTYIHDHAKRLHLELYKQDPTVKAFVHDLLAVENNAVRSAIRKAIFLSVKEKTDLKTFSKKIVNGYHLPTIPSTPQKDIMACLALMRQVARPLAKKASTRGGDTGFWTNLEAELDDLFEKNGNNRDDSKWREWEQDIIDADDRRYLRRGAESNARTQEEIDAAVLVGPASGSATVAASAPGSDGEDGDAQGLEERDVNIPGLGDLAALSVGPVVRDS